MPARQCLNALNVNDEVDEVYLIAAATLGQSRNGPYWRLDLQDAGGKLEAKIWMPLSSSFSEIETGRFARISGRVGSFREQLQLTVEAMRLLDDTEAATLDIQDFLPASRRPPAEMLAEIEELCKSALTHKPWRKLVLAVLRDEGVRAKLLLAPAAKNLHHAYCGGLLEHMLSVAGICLRLADHYNFAQYGSELDRQALLCAALMHDIGKTAELKGGLVTDYTDSGRMLGHIVQGLLILEPFIAKSGLEAGLSAHFRHLIVSHHGQHDYGSPAEPATAEAFILHYADNIDAKVAQIRALLPEDDICSLPLYSGNGGDYDPENNVDGLAWTAWQPTLNRRLARPVRTVQDQADSGKALAARVKAGQPNKDDSQCSLL